jgi:hypothetical protein
MAKIVVTFGRFNPPTAGHHLLSQEVMRHASEKGADHMIYGSMSTDPQKNPLTAEQKAKHMSRVLGTRNVHVGEGARNPFEMLKHLSDRGYKDVHVVLGSDRADEGIFKKMQEYVSAGELPGLGKLGIKALTSSTAGEARSDTAKGLAGVSGTKQRALVSAGDFRGFRAGLPPHVSKEHAKELFDDVKRGMSAPKPKKKVAKKKVTKKKLKENLYSGPLSFIINSFLLESEKKPAVQRKTSQNFRKRKQRENDRAKQDSGDLSQYMIVTTKQNNVEIITKGAFRRSLHVVVVPPEKMNSGALTKAAKDKNFRATPTSVKLGFGKKEDLEKEKKSPDKKTEAKTKSRKQEKEAPPPVPVKVPRVSKGGKSIYPDDDHTATDMEFGVVSMFNQINMGLDVEKQAKSGLITPAQAQELMRSQTLAAAGQRIVAQITESLPKGNWVAIHTGGKKDQPITKEWGAAGGSDNTPKADLILENKDTGETVRASVKCGEAQLMSGKTPETSGTFISALKVAEELGSLKPQTAKKVKKIMKKMKEGLALSQLTKQGPVSLYQTGGEREGKDKEIQRVEKLHEELTAELESLFEEDENFAIGVVYEAMTGVSKFGDGSLGTASHVLSMNKDGTNAVLTPITWDYCKKVARSIKIGVKFKSSAVEKKEIRAKWNEMKKKLGKRLTPMDDFRPYNYWSAFRIFLPKMNNMNEYFSHSILSLLLEQKIEDIPDPQTEQEVSQYIDEAEKYIGDDPVKLMLFLGVDISELSTPEIDFSEFSENNTGMYNTVVVNGKEIDIPVQKDVDFKNLQLPNKLDQDDASNYISESYIQYALRFVTEKRNYRKEYDNYQGKPDQVRNRSNRNKARRLLAKIGRVRKGDGKDVDHKNGNPKDNSVGNLRVTSKSHNRSKR